MKRILFFLGMIVGVAHAQITPSMPSIPGMTKINDKYNWLGGRFAALTLPAYGDTGLVTGQDRRAGHVIIDTTGSNKGMYVYFDGYFHRTVLYQELSDTAAAIRAAFPTGGGGLSGGNLGSGFRLYIPGSSGTRTLFNGYAVGIDSNSNTNGLTLKADTSLLQRALTHAQSVQKNNNTVTLVNDTTACDTCTYGSLTSVKRWYPMYVVDTTGLSAGNTFLKITGTRRIGLGAGGSSAPSGNNLDMLYLRNGAITTPGSDSAQYTANGLDIKGKYLVGGTQMVYRPDQTNFANTAIFGNGGASLSHSSGLQGQYLTVTGIGAGASLTSGSETVITGARACNSCNTITESVVVGSDAGFNFTGAARYVAIGKGAQQNGATPSSGVAIGWQALFNNTGNFNVGVGAQSLFTNSSGTHNTAVGFQAGYFNATGSGNTYMGEQAGTGVTGNNNSNNTGVGYRALNGVTTGSFNTVFGDSSAYTLTSGNGNIVIGRGMLTSSSTASSEMNIGGLLFGTGMTATGTSAAGNAGIGINTPREKLDVNGQVSIRTVNAGSSVDSILVIEDGRVKSVASTAVATRSIVPLQDFYTSVSNSGTSETDLYTFPIPANTLTTNGEKIIARFSGSFNDATGTETMKSYFAGTTTSNIGGIAGNPAGWDYEIMLTRSGTTTARVTVNFLSDGIFKPGITTALTGLDFTTTNIFKITGTSSQNVTDAIKADVGTIYWQATIAP